MLVRSVTINNQFVTASEWGVEWVAHRQNDETGAGDVDDASFSWDLLGFRTNESSRVESSLLLKLCCEVCPLTVKGLADPTFCTRIYVESIGLGRC